MSFPVAFQSAVFYFLACTPCAKVRHRQRAKVRAKKEREEKAKLETEQPGLYRHPSPFNTNPFWQDEITMGPSLPKKASSKNSSQRGLSSSGRDSDAPSVSEWTHVGDSGTNLGESTTVVMTDADGLSDDWNRKRGYQREDEELWGQWSGQKLMDAFSKARDSAGRLIETKLGLEKEVTEQTRREFYFSPKNPPVNDYHPPVVSNKAPQKGAHQWMLQPPPPAKIMEGKAPVGRAVSIASKSSARTAGSEGRLVYVQASGSGDRLRNAESLTKQELIELLFVSRTNRSTSFTRSRSLSLDGVDESVELAYERRRRIRRPAASPPGEEDEGDVESSNDEDEDEDEGEDGDTRRQPSRRLRPTGAPAPSGHVAQRPQLETIASTASRGSLRGSPNPAGPATSSNVTPVSEERPPQVESAA